MRVGLVERAMGGDQEAFAALAAESVDGCYRLAYRILRDPHRAQDAAQQALLGAWRDLPTLRDPDRFDAWLHRLVVNACYAEARSERRGSRACGSFPRHLARTGRGALRRRPGRARRRLRRLTPEQRAVVVLHHHLGYPLTEIAATLGIPEGTARSRLHYAVRQLRAVLDSRRRVLATSEERPA